MNKVILMGRLARDPDVRTTQSGKSVAWMTLAVDRRVAKNAPEGTQTADFLSLVAWAKLAEFAGKYLHKGSKILTEGRLQSRSYEGQDGQKRYVTEVNVSEIEFAESKKASSGEPTPGGFGSPVDDSDIPF